MAAWWVKIYLPQNYFAIRSVCENRWQIKLTGFSAESHDTFGSFRERHARFSMLFIASIPLPTLIRREIERQLAYQPELETKNRNPLLRTSTLGSAWELRFGPENQFRVFDRTEAERRQVHIFAVGMKVKERLFVGGKEFDL